ncbi:hypothetical protein HII31_06158 [Pseudocercospora fuligena]|uniref:Uncharacterized protein n=1 Tax=Pseudocercospora fuligena TaxID=685502 RepID=A0A8H6RHD7_9PEZI|nr:hypothetical protein HII31_06158 [Pseudocercospora fuligena]
MPTSAPILALPPKTTSSSSKNLKPNILPARIHHNGPIPVSSRHWSPAPSSTTSQESSFRGRRLLSQNIPLPENYTGLVIQKTDQNLPQQQDEEGEQLEVKRMEAIGSFDEIVVWGHEVQPDKTEDVYVRGLEEWIGMAESVNGYEDGGEGKGKGR